jgi:hypothetical protein
MRSQSAKRRFLATKNCSGFGNSRMFDVIFSPNHQYLWFTGDEPFVRHEFKLDGHFIIRSYPMTKVSGVGHIKESNTETYIRKIECLMTNQSFKRSQRCSRITGILARCIPNTNFSREINMDNRYRLTQTLTTKEVNPKSMLIGNKPTIPIPQFLAPLV